ncbi:MAG: hypothetical protein DHS20C15_01170 [Planctomycetota bacterium]|nr:MAG: hypothetical protein DHS20C15_01170 [Planctomycetota bacterium]
MARVLTAVLALTLIAGPVLAHGGQYKGPSDAGSPGSNSGGTVAPPTNPAGAAGAGPGAPAAAGPTSAPRGTGSRSARGGGDREGGPTSGGTLTPVASFDIWEFWWENNKDRFLNLKGRLINDRGVSGGTGFLTGRGRRNTASTSRRPNRTEINQNVIPALVSLVQNETDGDILDSAILALGRTTEADLADQVADEAVKLLAHNELSVQSSSALALGVLGSAKANQMLIDILAENSAGKRAVGGGSPHFLVRAFAALSLGLIGESDGVDALMSTIDGLGDSDFEIKVGAIVGLGLIGSDHPRTHDVREFLEKTLKDRKLDQLIKSYVPTSIGKLGHASSAPALLANFLDRDTDNVVRQSSAIGLGQVATMADTETIEALLDYVKEGRDIQTRHFAIIALGEIGARDEAASERQELHDSVRDQLLKEIQKKGKSQAHRSWAGLSAAIYARGQKEAQPRVIETLKSAYKKESDMSFRGAFAVALGLIGDQSPETSEMIYEDLREKSEQDFRGYAGVALGFLQYQEAAEDLRSLVQNKAITPTLRLQAATALGLMSDTQAVGVLIETLDSARTLGVSSAVAKALGLIGDKESIAPLNKIAADDSRQKITRAFACVALGIVGEKTDLPWNAAISANNNYRAKVSSIEEVLDIL